LGNSRQNGTGSYQLFDSIVQGDSAVLNKDFVDTALGRDEADDFHTKRLRKMRRGLILTLVVSAGSWAIIFYVARIVFQ
jgi:hypothetical protein